LLRQCFVSNFWSGAMAIKKGISKLVIIIGGVLIAAAPSYAGEPAHEATKTAPDLSRARQIAQALERTSAARKDREYALTVISVLVNFIPGLGGAMGRVVDEANVKFNDPDLEGKFVEICKLLSDLSPQLSRIDDLDARLQAVTETVRQNQSIMDRIATLASAMFPIMRQFNATNIASEQEFVNVTITNMKSTFVTTGGGTTTLNHVQSAGGDVDFRSQGGGRQVVTGSQFSGDRGGVGLDKLQIQGPVGTRTDDGPGPSVVFGPGGSIGFGPGGSMIFQAPPQR
jgi:hypothetical protein